MDLVSWLMLMGAIASILALLVVLVSHLRRRKARLVVEPLNVARDLKLAESQFANMKWIGSGQPGVADSSHSFSAWFGVLRVSCHGGHAFRCGAGVRFRIDVPSYDAESGRRFVTSVWRDGGHLNWYSPTLRQNLATLGQFDVRELTRYIANTTEDLRDGDVRDLLLCYEPVGSRVSFLCSDMVGLPFPMFNPGESTRVRVEVTFTADGMEPTTSTYDVTVSLDRISIERFVAVPQIGPGEPAWGVGA